MLHSFKSAPPQVLGARPNLPWSPPKCLLNLFGFPIPPSRLFQNYKSTRGKSLNPAGRRMPERNGFPFREVNFGIAECQHLARVRNIALAITVAELCRGHRASTDSMINDSAESQQGQRAVLLINVLC